MNDVTRKAIENALNYEEQAVAALRGRQATLRKDADALEQEALKHESNAAGLRLGLGWDTW